MKELLTNKDFCRAAKKLKCEVAAIKAVANTESAGKGFYSDDFPVILFERHLFRKFTGGKYSKDYPELSGPQGNYGAAGQNQKNKFNKAFELDPDAAMKACSWGKFQILGSNHKACGYNTVGQFVDAMKENEGKHLDAFVGFVITNGLDKHLRNLDWKAFARGYNGPAYKKNAYDTKMASAYKKFAKENINCNGLPEILPTDTTPPPAEDTQPTEVVNNDEQQQSDSVKVSVKDGDVKVETTNGKPEDKEKIAIIASPKPKLWERLYAKAAGALTGNVIITTLSDKIGALTGITISPTAWLIIILTIITFSLVWIAFEAVKVIQERHRQKELDKVLLEQNSTPHNIVQIVDQEDATLFAAKGWKIVNRGTKLPTEVTDSMKEDTNDSK